MKRGRLDSDTVIYYNILYYNATYYNIAYKYIYIYELIPKVYYPLYKPYDNQNVDFIFLILLPI